MNKFCDNDIHELKKYIDKIENSEISIDISKMNIFEALEFVVMSSAYFFQKFPNGKLKCKTHSKDLENLTSSFRISNLEFV